MMNLLGCTKENFYQLMSLMNYKKHNKNDEKTFVYKGVKKEKKNEKIYQKNKQSI